MVNLLPVCVSLYYYSYSPQKHSTAALKNLLRSNSFYYTVVTARLSSLGIKFPGVALLTNFHIERLKVSSFNIQISQLGLIIKWQSLRVYFKFFLTVLMLLPRAI